MNVLRSTTKYIYVLSADSANRPCPERSRTLELAIPFKTGDTVMTDSTALPADIAQLSFEVALKQLEDLVRTLEQGRIGLDDAIGAYERGALLKRHCAEKLREAEARIERISLDGAAPDGLPEEAVGADAGDGGA